MAEHLPLNVCLRWLHLIRGSGIYSVQPYGKGNRTQGEVLILILIHYIHCYPVKIRLHNLLDVGLLGPALKGSSYKCLVLIPQRQFGNLMHCISLLIYEV